MSPNTPHTPHDFANPDKTSGTPGFQTYDSPVHLAPGKTIMDKFVVIEHLGTGGMGSVFKVQHLHLKTFYALKCLNHKQGNDAIWRRFENEARAANRLDHPNLIKVHDSGLLSDGQPYFVMDLVEGTTLSQELERRGTITLVQALKIFIQVGFALSYAHSNGVIHRDIKPSNIMLVKNTSGSLGGSVKVVDFGIAKLTGKDEYNQMTLTRTGEVFGSPLYMSPEQCMGIAVDHRSDLYSLGCVMYEALTGAPPVVGDNALTTMMRHQTETPIPMRQASLGLEFPDAIEHVVAKLLEKDPEKRYESANLLTADLVAIEQGHVVKEHELADNARSLVAIPRALTVKHQDSHTMLFVVAILILVLGFSMGFLVGRGVPVSTQPSTEPNTANSASNASRASKPRRIDDTEGNFPPAELESDQTFSNLDAKPFSTLYEGGKKRVFDFPKNKTLATRCSKDWKQLPTRKCLLSGQVIIDDFEPMYLTFDWTTSESPVVFAKFRDDEVAGVKITNISKNVTEILNHVSKYKPLTKLWLECTPFNKSNIAQVNTMKHLTSLNLRGSMLSGHDIASLVRLRQLADLNCGSTEQMGVALVKLKGSNALQGLSLNTCSLTREDLKSIAQIPNLKDLDLTNNNVVTDETLKDLSVLSKLEVLDLQECSITAKSIATLERMHALKFVKLPRKGWRREEMAALEKMVRYVNWYEPREERI